MPYEEVKAQPRAHMLTLKNRRALELDGVTDVSGFDESIVVLSTTQGDLTVRGEGLHIKCVDLEQGRLEIEGHVQLLSYDEPERRGSFWSRLFS